MYLLAIETSCDETSVALLKNQKLVAQKISSQISIHAPFGGVVPELASRNHCEILNLLIEDILSAAKITFQDLNICAVTYGPGLEGSLLVGIAAAKTISHLLKIPLIPINHLHGHIYANFLSNPTLTFPAICLIVSGGHTSLVKINHHFDFEVIGQTRDDAAGEAFDKIAKYLGLSYPGGPIIEKQAYNGQAHKYKFPKPILKNGFEFSFSGLKTAVIQTVRSLKHEKTSFKTEDICASFQQTVIDVLTYKTIKACQTFNIGTILLSGGVCANQSLRKAFQAKALQHSLKLFIPEPIHCTDNAAMIGMTAYYYYQKISKNPPSFSVSPNLKIQ
jgi:N6-L-threonylcarbamoyladenine synthase